MIKKLLEHNTFFFISLIGSGVAIISVFRTLGIGVSHYSWGSLLMVMTLAIIPAYLWIQLFLCEHEIQKRHVSTAFFLGCISTFPPLLYKMAFENKGVGNAVFFNIEAVNFQENISGLLGFSSLEHIVHYTNGENLLSGILMLLCVYLGVGILEEGFKQIVINKDALPYMIFATFIAAISYFFTAPSFEHFIFVGNLFLFYSITMLVLIRSLVFKSIDDVMEISIFAALGFSFIENILYFAPHVGQEGFIALVLVRVILSTLIHVLCSGIMGYHIGLAHFAKPVLKDEFREGRTHPIINMLHTIFKTKRSKIFYYEQVAIGVILASVVHGLYDAITHIEGNLGLLLPFLKNTVIGEIQLIAIALPLFFLFGMKYLFERLEDAEDKKEFGQLVRKEIYTKKTS